MKIYFATSNPGKFREAKELLEKHGIGIVQYKAKLTEIQSNSAEEIALHSVREAHSKLKKPVFVEDTGLFIKSLKDFPGVYSKHAFYTIGLNGILKLLKGEKNRTAKFQAVIAYKSARHEKVFKGTCLGSIAHKIRGRGGFGFDPIFLPSGRDKTFAEDVRTKASLSHRAKALKKLAKYLE